MRYPADIRPVAWILFIVALSLVPFVIQGYWQAPWWALAPYWLPVLYARTFAPYAQHNHGHLPVFRSRPLNWIYDVLIAQCTGYATALWELHHVRGHHRNFLTPEKDVARLTDLKTGKVVPRWWYALRGNLTIVQDSIRIGRTEADARDRNLTGKLFVEMATQALVTVGLALWNPWLTLWFFVIPNFVMSWFIWWESYQHHHEVPANNIYDASVTITERWFNFQTFNLGYHTAHHEKPTLHWSLLPRRTEEILGRIPDQCMQARYKFFASAPRRPVRAENRGSAGEHLVARILSKVLFRF